ncbi:hypothetical protein [Streptomyces sp. NPDC096152]|uniref:hypothetical protein n=1 Tax=Streptomyces sp. NPDC096152 TaxID=3366078 RepID=UPI0038085453
MNTSEENDTSHIDEEVKERSAEQRNITAPTPPDVRAEGEHEENWPPAAKSQAP